jgi:outer membrane receptor protein involved in Fe transport
VGKRTLASWPGDVVVRTRASIISGFLAVFAMFALARTLPAEPVELFLSDAPVAEAVELRLQDELWLGQYPRIEPASLLQPQPLLLPPAGDWAQPVAEPSALRSRDPDSSGVGFMPSPRSLTPALRFFVGQEAPLRAATDPASLIGKSPTGLGISVQKRNPIVNEPRIRSSAVGTLAASGSYWVPARIDLDTMLGKLDARAIDHVTVINGPYSSRLGPDYKFIELQPLAAPRAEQGSWTAASTALDYLTNGRQVHGRQVVQGAAEQWGFRVAYGHRTANDYRDGTGSPVPASFNSRSLDAAWSCDLDEERSLAGTALRLDQTGVELPGQAFDLNFLGTDAYSLCYVAGDLQTMDQFVFDTWYNGTTLQGDNSRVGKPAQFPAMDLFELRASTDVACRSSGFRLACIWGEEDGPRLTAGADLRWVFQELNEFADAEIGDVVLTDIWSPLPRSQWIDSGLYADFSCPCSPQLRLGGGVRVDGVYAEIVEDAANLTSVTSRRIPLASVYETDEFAQYFFPWSAYLTGRWDWGENWSLLAAAGRAVRPPSLTELYVAESFMLLLQNGQNTITGDPLLKPERVWQIDLGVLYESHRLRCGANVFHAWMLDYVTFENLSVFRIQGGAIEQVNLKYVNTALATKTGLELQGAWEATERCLAFATFAYVAGRDHTRDGEFATEVRSDGNYRIYGAARGAFSGISAAAAEPLPMIFPWESRLGVQWHPAVSEPNWKVELAVRIVGGQDRLATSLVESATPGFSVWDLRSFWQVTDRLLITAGVENLADRAYREHLDFRSASGRQLLQPGRNFYVGTEARY